MKALQTKLNGIQSQTPKPTSVQAGRGLLEMIKKAEEMKQQSGDSHVSVDHLVCQPSVAVLASGAF